MFTKQTTTMFENETTTGNVNKALDNDCNQSCSWNQVINKRKMTDTSLPTTMLKIPRSNNSKIDPKSNQKSDLGLTLSNRFEPLIKDQSLSNNSMEALEDTPSKSSRPPPIFLNSDVQYVPMCKVLSAVIGDNFKCSSSTKGITLYVSTPEAYRACVKYLKEQNADFHSYQLLEDKPFRVVIRGLHPSIDHETLTEELKDKGHIVRAISNVLSHTKQRLPLFFVDLEIAENNEDIFDLEVLMYSKVVVESPRPKRQLVQCTRCQQYGHTKTYCNHPYKCVRCAGNHDSSSCQKPKDTPATCALCGQSHPSNYRGCNVYKELQKRRSTSALKTKPSPQRQQPVPNSQDTTLFPKLQTSYTTPSPPGQVLHHSPATNNNAQATDFSSQNPSPSYSQATTNGDVTHQLNNFITEMKHLLTPLITLVTQLIQALMTQNGKK